MLPIDYGGKFYASQTDHRSKYPQVCPPADRSALIAQPLFSISSHSLAAGGEWDRGCIMVDAKTILESVWDPNTTNVDCYFSQPGRFLIFNLQEISPSLF